MLFEILIIVGLVAPPAVRLVIGVVALYRCNSGDVPEVVKALAFDKKIK